MQTRYNILGDIMDKINVIFMGTPDFAVSILEYLIETTNVVLVVTQTDKEVGRKKELTFSPIKKVAVNHNIKVFQPIKIKNDYEIIKKLKPDLIITCAYGQILPKELLDIPTLGCLNVHASLLPEYRGATPMQRAIMDGKTQTGVTLMYMDEGMDTGDIIAKLKCPITKEDNIGSLHDKLSLLGVQILKQELNNIILKTNQRIKQDNSKATYTHLIKREDELINFNDKGNNIINKIRAFNPYPLAYFKIDENEIKVIKASFIPKKTNKIGLIIYDKKQMFITCQDGLINLEIIKPFGKKQMPISAYLNGIKKEENTYVN